MAETPEEDKSDISSLDDREKEGSHNLHVPVAYLPASHHLQSAAPQSESDKPAKKKAKEVVDSHTDSDFLAASPPPGPRPRRDECTCNVLLRLS